MAIAIPAFAGGDESDGHTHAAPQPVPTKATAPRAAAVSEEFEAVIVLEERKLVLYLDRFASNEPVAGAKVEIEGGGLKGVAAEKSPGVYAIDAGTLGASSVPAKHALTIAVEAGDVADLLSATLEIVPPQAGVAHVHLWGEWTVWLVAGALVLAGGVMMLVRRRRKWKGAR